MRNFFIKLLGVQVFLICCGVWQITQGEIDNGLFNVISNILFSLLNIWNINLLKKELENESSKR
jgi:hypothetical protein